MGQLSVDIEQAEAEGGDGPATLGKGSHILNAKSKLMDILIEKLSEYLQAVDGKGSVEILQGMTGQFNVLLQQSLELGQVKLEQACKAKDR